MRIFTSKVLSHVPKDVGILTRSTVGCSVGGKRSRFWCTSLLCLSKEARRIGRYYENIVGRPRGGRCFLIPEFLTTDSGNLRVSRARVIGAHEGILDSFCLHGTLMGLLHQASMALLHGCQLAAATARCSQCLGGR